MASPKRRGGYVPLRGFEPNLNIRQPHIDDATPGDAFSCIIVRAIQDMFPDARRVRANTETISWNDPETDSHYRLRTPEVAIEKVIRPLDEHREVKPTVIPLVGLEGRPINHRQAARTRNAARELKKRDPVKYKRQHQGPAATSGKYKRLTPPGQE